MCVGLVYTSRPSFSRMVCRRKTGFITVTIAQAFVKRGVDQIHFQIPATVFPNSYNTSLRGEMGSHSRVSYCNACDATRCKRVDVGHTAQPRPIQIDFGRHTVASVCVGRQITKITDISSLGSCHLITFCQVSGSIPTPQPQP